jgi:TatD DNase family protein
MAWVDQHCHIPPGAEGATQVAEARAAGVTRMVTVGTTLEQSRQMMAVARAHDGVWATAGVHPHDAKDGIEGLEDLLDAPEVVAVGEAGLDYHHDHSPRDVQADVFRRQIAMAHDRDLPLVIHTRNAWDDTFAVLDAEGTPRRTVFHCFTGGAAEGEECLARGALLSFSGIITFPSGGDLRDAAELCPLDRLLVETDSPYLAPVPHRGKPNRPALVPLVGAAVAATKQCEVAEVEAATWATASRFYGLDEPRD